MTPELQSTLAKLIAEHPEWCFRCGNWHPPSDNIHVCYLYPVNAFLITAIEALDAQHEADAARIADQQERLQALVQEWNIVHSHLEVEREAHEATKEALDAAEARVKELERAATKAERWLWDPDENQLEQFERIADEFYAATGHLRPGKDDPIEDTSSPENRKRWQEWSQGRNREVLASLRAALKGESPSLQPEKREE